MSKTLLFTALAAATGVCAAQDVGRVVASSPIYRQVEVPQQVCTTEEVQVQPSQWQPQQNCRSQSRIETRAVGYQVTYEYAGRRYDTQTATAPGSTIPLRVSAMGVSSLAPPLPAEGATPATAGPAYGSDSAARGGSYSTLQPAEDPDAPVQAQPGVVVPTTTYTTVRRVVQPVPVIVQPPPVYLTPAYPAYAPGYGYGGYGYGGGYGGGYYPGVSAWGGVPIGLSLNLGYTRGRWR